MKRITKGIDKQLLILTVVLFAWGLIMIYSASNITAFMYGANPGRYFFKQSIFLIIGAIGSFILIRFNTKKYYGFSVIGTIVFASLIAFLVFYGRVTNGARNWIGFEGFSVQPSEFVKVMIIPFIAMYYQKYEREKDVKKVLLPLVIAVIIFGLIVLQNDYGTAFIFILIAFGLFFFSNVSKRIKSMVLLGGLAAVFILGILIATGNIPQSKLARLKSNQDPCEITHYLNEGNQLCNSYIAINGGGIFGKGLGNSTQKYLYLPESHTDYIFAIIVEELGVIGGTLLVGLYFLLLIRIIKIGKKSNNNAHAMICYGVAIYLFLHMAVNLLGVTGVVPLTGIPLPFMSYGGSFALCQIIALIMVQRISIETKLQKN